MGRPREFDVTDALDRIKELFWRHGFESTSLGDLTSASGVGRQSLYNTFGDKRQLYLAALRRYIESDLAAGYAVLERPGASADAIAAYFAWIVDTYAAAVPRRGCFVANATTELAPRDPDVAKLVRSVQQRLGAALLAAIRLGVERGDVGGLPDTPEAVARHLTCASMGITVAAKAGFSRGALADMARVALEALA